MRRVAIVFLTLVALGVAATPVSMRAAQGALPGPRVRILVLHGPNTNLFGIREPDVYGRVTFQQINERIQQVAKDLGVEVTIGDIRPVPVDRRV
jgi:ABC-type sugar transport system substrate-binding protein